MSNDNREPPPRDPTHTGYAYAPDDLAARVRALVDVHGYQRTSDILLLAKSTVIRICGGIVVRRGSVAMLRFRFAELDAEKTKAEPAT